MWGARIFVSYSTRSKTTESLLTGLEPILIEAGHRLWRDKRSLEPGDAFRTEIFGELLRCDGALLLLSEEALQSEWVRDEAKVLTMRKHAAGDGFALVPWLLPGVTWEAAEPWFPVAQLQGFQALYGLGQRYEDVAAMFRNVAAGRRALGEALTALAAPIRREIARALELAMPPTEGVVSEVATLMDLARQEGRFDDLWELAHRDRAEGSGDLAAGLTGIARFLDGRPEVAKALCDGVGVSTNPDLARRLVEDAERTLEILVELAERDVATARELGRRALPWTPMWHKGGQPVAEAGPNVVAVHGWDPAHASFVLASRTGAPATVSGSSAGLVSRSEIKLPAALKADVRRSADTYTDALCKQVIAGLVPHGSELDRDQLRLLARGMLRRLQSPNLPVDRRGFRYVVDHLDDVLKQVAQQVPELFVVVMEPLNDPDRILQHGSIVALLAMLFGTEE